MLPGRAWCQIVISHLTQEPSVSSRLRTSKTLFGVAEVSKGHAEDLEAGEWGLGCRKREIINRANEVPPSLRQLGVRKCRWTGRQRRGSLFILIKKPFLLENLGLQDPSA